MLVAATLNAKAAQLGIFILMGCNLSQWWLTDCAKCRLFVGVVSSRRRMRRWKKDELRGKSRSIRLQKSLILKTSESHFRITYDFCTRGDDLINDIRFNGWPVSMLCMYLWKWNKWISGRYNFLFYVISIEPKRTVLKSLKYFSFVICSYLKFMRKFFGKCEGK